MRQKISIAVLFLAAIIFIPTDCFSLIKEDKQDNVMPALETLIKGKPSYNLATYSGLFSGYDSNARLDSTKKGDTFGQFLYPLNFSRQFTETMRFNLYYDLDVLEYRVINDASSILNHLRYEFYKKAGNWFGASAGYDLGVFYYPNNSSSDFLLHTCFLSFRNHPLKNLYQKLSIEYGLKNFNSKKAFDDSLDDYQDKNRHDRRYTIKYNADFNFFKKVTLGLGAKFLKNDSNAIYMRYYDYDLYEVSPNISYRLLRGVDLVSNFSYIRKSYKSRLVTLADYRQKDEKYGANAGARYRLNNNNTLSFFYTYRKNFSNEAIERYTENVYTCGWQYLF